MLRIGITLRNEEVDDLFATLVFSIFVNLLQYGFQVLKADWLRQKLVDATSKSVLSCLLTRQTRERENLCRPKISRVLFLKLTNLAGTA